MAWDDIAENVQNLAGEESTRDCVKRAYDRFNSRTGVSKYQYHKCGRKRWKLTPELQNWIVRRLLQQRKKEIVTSKTLQADLVTEKGVTVTKVVPSELRRNILEVDM